MKRISCQYHIDTACVREICGNGVHRLFRYCGQISLQTVPRPQRAGVAAPCLTVLPNKNPVTGVAGFLFVLCSCALDDRIRSLRYHISLRNMAL